MGDAAISDRSPKLIIADSSVIFKYAIEVDAAGIAIGRRQRERAFQPLAGGRAGNKTAPLCLRRLSPLPISFVELLQRSFVERGCCAAGFQLPQFRNGSRAPAIATRYARRSTLFCIFPDIAPRFSKRRPPMSPPAKLPTDQTSHKARMRFP